MMFNVAIKECYIKSKSFLGWINQNKSSAKNYISTFMATGLIQGIGIATGILTARLLGPVGKGDLATVFWLPGLMVGAGILALPQAITFKVSRNPAQSQQLASIGFWLSLCLGLVEVVILFPFIPVIFGVDKQHLVSIGQLFLFSLPIIFPGLTLLGVDQGQQAFRRYNSLRILPAVFYIVAILLLWLLQKISLSTVIISNLFAQLLSTGIRVGLAGSQLYFPHNLFSPQLAKQILKQGVAFHLPTLAGIILMRVDMFLLICMASSEQIGYYSVALAIAMGQIGMSTTFVQVSFPKMAANISRNRRELLLRQVRLSVPLITGMAFVVTFCTPWIIRFLFGVEFLPALHTTYFLVWALAIWGVNQVIDNGLRGMGYGRPGVEANIFAIFVLIIIVLVFTNTVNERMAFAMLTAQVCGFFILFFNTRKIA